MHVGRKVGKLHPNYDYKSFIVTCIKSLYCVVHFLSYFIEFFYFKLMNIFLRQKMFYIQACLCNLKPLQINRNFNACFRGLLRLDSKNLSTSGAIFMKWKCENTNTTNRVDI